MADRNAVECAVVNNNWNPLILDSSISVGARRLERYTAKTLLTTPRLHKKCVKNNKPTKLVSKLFLSY